MFTHRFPLCGRVETNDDNSTALSLGLYLLVLAFFSVLVSLSSLQKTKANAVVRSVTTAFAPDGESGLGPMLFI